MKDLIAISEADFDVKIDIKYATNDNLCSQKLYTKPHCFLHKSIIDNLLQAIKLAAKENLMLKIWDCYRPLEVQQFMFDFFKDKIDAAKFISDPKTGIKTHCRGVAIDLTLIDKKTMQELDMGTDFDEFSDLAFHACKKISTKAQQNRIKLLNIMTLAGFDFIPNEWWHYQAFEPKKFEIIKSDPSLINPQILDFLRRIS